MPLTGAAAVRLYDDHVDAVHALITRRIGPVASPEVTGEAFEHAMRTWDRFDRDRGTERLFLFGAAVAVIRRHEQAESRHLHALRSQRASGAPTVADPLVPGSTNTAPRVVDHQANHDVLSGALSGVGRDDDSTGSSDMSQDRVARTMAAVADLAPDDRDILLMSLWESCPQSDVAEVLDLSVSSVRSALGRIRRELKVATSEQRVERKRRK